MSTNEDRIVIELSQGTIFGTEEKLPNGGKMCGFKGIPYARPPVGNLRFMVIQFLTIYNTIYYSIIDLISGSSCAR